MPFSHSLLWANPTATLAFFSLMMSIVSIWIHRSGWLWGPFLGIAVALALIAGIVTPPALLPLALLLLVYSLLRERVSGITRIALIGVAVALSTGLSFHLFPGFHNWMLADKQLLSENAVPYTFFLNFDKPFIGIFVLAWCLPLIRSKRELVRVFKRALPLTAIAVAGMISLSVYGGGG